MKIIRNNKSLKVEELEKSRLVIYPNPSQTWAQVQYELPINAERGVLRITSTSGQVVQELPVNQQDGTITLLTKGWTAGVYFVALYSNEELVEQTTLVVKH